MQIKMCFICAGMCDKVRFGYFLKGGAGGGGGGGLPQLEGSGILLSHACPRQSVNVRGLPSGRRTNEPNPRCAEMRPRLFERESRDLSLLF